MPWDGSTREMERLSPACYYPAITRRSTPGARLALGHWRGRPAGGSFSPSATTHERRTA